MCDWLPTFHWLDAIKSDLAQFDRNQVTEEQLSFGWHRVVTLFVERCAFDGAECCSCTRDGFRCCSCGN